MDALKAQALNASWHLPLTTVGSGKWNQSAWCRYDDLGYSPRAPFFRGQLHYSAQHAAVCRPGIWAYFGKLDEVSTGKAGKQIPACGTSLAITGWRYSRRTDGPRGDKVQLIKLLLASWPLPVQSPTLGRAPPVIAPHWPPAQGSNAEVNDLPLVFSWFTAPGRSHRLRTRQAKPRAQLCGFNGGTAGCAGPVNKELAITLTVGEKRCRQPLQKCCACNAKSGIWD